MQNKTICSAGAAKQKFCFAALAMQTKKMHWQCSTHNAAFTMQHSQCSIHNAAFTMQHWQCIYLAGPARDGGMG